MQPLVTFIACTVLRQASRERPADAVLRQVLRSEHDITPLTAAEAARAVFAACRWRNWLKDPLDIQHALTLQQQFQSEPRRFSNEELLARAIPEWVHQEMPVSSAWVRALQTEPVLWLRSRPGRTEELAVSLGDCELSGRMPTALAFRGQRDLFRSPQFHAGEFEVQDISSQAVGLLCGARAGETWWDACAGEGGKTLHLSDLMENRGLIWASDRAAWRLRRLKLRAARASMFNYRTASWDGGARLPTKTKFDGVLIDAPCSGLGTWQRNPHARWTTTPEDVRELADRQQQLLAHAAPAVKPGGRLVYAACTLTRLEGEGVVSCFEKTHPEFQPVTLESPFSPGTMGSGQLLWWPQETRGNGMFVAVWQRKAD